MADDTAPAAAFISLRITEPMRDALDDLRRYEPDVPNQSTMIRRLIARAYHAQFGAYPEGYSDDGI